MVVPPLTWARSLDRLAILALLFAACAPTSPPTGSRPLTFPPPQASPVPTESSAPGAALAPGSTAFWDERHGIILGSPGEDPTRTLVATTRDGGQTWTNGPVLAAPLSRVTVVEQNDAWATGACEEPCPPRLFHSDDGGMTWRAMGSDVSIVTFVDRLHGWGTRPGGTGGDGEQLFETHDGGAAWTPTGRICSRTWPEVAGLRFVDDRHGWIMCGGMGSGTMGPSATYETLDSGMKWRLRSSVILGAAPIVVGRPPSGPVVGAFFLRSGQAWVWQGRSGTATSRDGGASWEQSPPGKPEEVFVDPMWFVNDRVGFALVFADGATQLWTTVEDGSTWRPVHRW
jgi:photosystem II stability/assembly factor-like uncharacterized protein